MRLRARFLALPLLAVLGGGGCFWLEPIEPFVPEEPDPGPCDPDAVSALGVALRGFEPTHLRLREGAAEVRAELSLAEAAPGPIWVRLSTTDARVAVPAVTGLCFSEGETTRPVPVRAVGPGQANLVASLSSDRTATLPVEVLDARQPPVLASLDPARRFVSAGESIPVTVTLDRAASEPTTAVLTATGGLVVPGAVTIPAGVASAQVSVEVPPGGVPRGGLSVSAKLGEDAPAIAVFRRASVVISEVRIHEAGFIELHNPSRSEVDLSNWRLRLRRTGSGWDLAQHPLRAGTRLAPGGYLLCALTSSFEGTSDCAFSYASGALERSELRVQLDDASSDTVDRIWLGGDRLPLPTTFSLERKAWSGVSAEQMQTGDHQRAGNGWDSDEDADFHRRDVPEPQGSADSELLE